jgi:hypothetical protein
MSEELINKGIAVVGTPKRERGPVVIIGTARGGTSMIAGALEKLGVFMGERSSPPVFEDMTISEVMESKNFSIAKEIVKKYSESHSKWGWKRPSSIEYLDEVEKVFDSPAYIFIFKDIFSIAQRNAISMLSDLLPAMGRALSQYEMSLAFLRETNPYAMLISYEKAVSYPEFVVSALIDFYELSPSEQQVNDAIAFIAPNPVDYLDASRITKAHGRLGGILGRTVYGWARYVHAKKPAYVELFLNETKFGTVLANLPRADLDERFGTPCAYVFALPEGVNLTVGDSLRARVVNEIRDLDNSPYKVSDEGSGSRIPTI